MEEWRDKRVTVAGLGHFGGAIAVAKWLIQQGARVLVTDKAAPEKLADSVRQLEGLPVEFRLGEHQFVDFTSADLVVTSPAIKPASPYLAAAREARVPITTEIRLFIERCPARIVAVTGTKGKSTTTALLGRMLATGRRTHVGGNIGRSLLPDLDDISKDDLVVLELSSFMLHYLRELKWSPHVAVLTMLAVDHIDWHGSAEAYLDAKALLVRHQRKDDFAILGEGMPHMAELAALTPARVIWYHARGRRFNLLIPGEHNQLNAQAALAAASVFGVTFDQAQAAVGDFHGLPHRLQLVHESGGVHWYNDSIATIPEAAVAALEAFPPRKVIQIVGGSDKGIAFDGMCRALNARAKAVLSIGDTGPSIMQLLEKSFDRPPAHACERLENAVEMARRLAEPGDVVLLSTGCASYDQFTNFEERGEQFGRLARGD